ncbi:MAG: Lrp/AsnC ligand binding domain-containing protein [archaeon]|nr:Lrp/AsnC ligand binding domain-containing protein [archaeon]MCP8305977.1 Lrp/AsnC ligand binding domain-containing protein [archaeon]
MPVAFVLINADLGTERELLKELGKIENVEEAHFVYGVYDIIAKISADSMEKVKETVARKIRRLDKVRSTLTMIVIESL